MLELHTTDLTDNRRFAAPISPYRRGFEDATYERTYANPYRRSTPANAAYNAAFHQATANNRALAAYRRPCTGARVRTASVSDRRLL